MTPVQIVAVVFVSLLILFLIVAYFLAERMSEGQWVILRVLCALCAALAAGFITGEAVFEMKGTIGEGGSYAISGVMGFALFLVVWFFFPKIAGAYPDAIVLGIPPHGWTFEHAARTIAAQDQSTAEFVGFRSDELEAELRGQQVRAKTVASALASLRNLADPGAVRSYSVTHEPPVFTLKAG